MYRYLFIFAFFSFFFASCGEEDTYQTRMENERNERNKYLKQQGITNKHLLDEGVYYQVLYTPENVENAKKIEVGDEVVVYYTGMFLDGTIFDSNVLHGRYEPMTVRIQNRISGEIINKGVSAGRVIQGWPPILLQMYEGSKARGVIPSNRAYGIFGSSGVPGYTSLVFEFEVEEVRKR